MPSRRATLAIVLFWIACQVWFVRREYLPRWTASDAGPEFAVDLADEAAVRYSNWIIYRDDKKLGTLTARTTFLPAEDAFEQESRFQNLELNVVVPFVGTVKARAPSLISTSVVGRDGQLQSLKTEAKFEIDLDSSGKKGALPKLAFEAAMAGKVTGGMFGGESELRSIFGSTKAPVEPFPVRRGNAFNPMQPQDRILGAVPGRRWRMTRIDPVSDTFLRASLQSVTAMAQQAKAGAPDLRGVLDSKDADDLIAEVLADPQALEWKGQPELCRVIQYSGEGAAGKTWVRISDGKVLQQQATGHGETLTLVRDN